MRITAYGAVVIFPPYVPIYYEKGLRGTIAAIRAAKGTPGAVCLICDGKTQAFPRAKQ